MSVEPVHSPRPVKDDPDRGTDAWPHAAVLVVDDEDGMRHFLEKALAPRCALVAGAANAREGQARMDSQRFDLIILDIAMPGISGVTWLKALREQGYSGEVILITAYADLDMAIEALRAGASDFILKPFRVPQILHSVRRCMERSRLKRENYVLRRNLGDRHELVGMVGSAPPMLALNAALQRVAAAPSTVLLTGESGTGKELAARALHNLGPRAGGPFVPVNCASLSPELIESELFGHARGALGGATRGRDGLFYYAQGGTLFLDEVAELPPSVQATLLRVLEDRRIRPVGSDQQVAIDVRIVAATHRDLVEAVASGRFRKDLYYRLQVVELTLPPLRERLSDVPALVAHFMAQLAPPLGMPPITISEGELAYLRQYDWPGNVRELRNLIERSLILGELNVSALYPRKALPAPPPDRPTDLQALEKQHILHVLASVDGDKTRAAQLLGVSRRTLERRVAEWHIA